MSTPLQPVVCEHCGANEDHEYEVEVIELLDVVGVENGSLVVRPKEALDALPATGPVTGRLVCGSCAETIETPAGIKGVTEDFE